MYVLLQLYIRRYTRMFMEHYKVDIIMWDGKMSYMLVGLWIERENEWVFRIRYVEHVII